MLRILISTGFLLLALTANAGSANDCGLEAKPCVEYGAKVFSERCALCHGSDGLGEGILSLSIKEYPNTNLLEAKHATDDEKLRKVIVYGGGLEEVSHEMPPWGDELTSTQLESVTVFVSLLKKDLEQGLVHLKTASADIQPSIRIGRAVFQGRCSLCHGKYGLGDGKMARIIKNPPPFNLTLSQLPDDYLSDIIHKGGEAMGRSGRMPPFGDDLSESEIKSVMMHLKSLRAKP